MEVRYLPNRESYQRLNTPELRGAFALEQLFQSGAITMVYCDADRAIVGGAMPVDSPLTLLASKKEMAAEYFTERRELGIVNIGGDAVIRAGGAQFSLAKKDMLYIGRGVKDIEFSSVRPATPAVLYFVSYPAHTAYPITPVRFADAQPASLGTQQGANVRIIRKYIHAGGAKSCQLVMGLTELAEGSIWNTMPPHTHQRRTEVYLYYDLPADGLVVHLMGAPDGTRNLMLRDKQAVISPSWSVHCGAATTNYSFIWAMGGENQEFTDMDAVPMQELL